MQAAHVAVLLGRKVEQVEEALDILGEILLSRGFLGRLKWLITGR